jgi:hypothetical protein
VAKLNPIEAGTQDYVVVNGEQVDLSAPLTNDLTADNTITAAGADSGSTPSASTLYYHYLSNSSASPFPEELRLCATAPTNGYLGAAGNAANWRHIGSSTLNGSTQYDNGGIYQESLMGQALESYISWMNMGRVISGNAIIGFIDGNQFHNIYFLQNTPYNIGDTFEHDFWLLEGDYNFKILATRSGNSGIIAWSLDGVVFVASEDWYGSTYNVITSHAVTVSSTGKHVVSGSITGKNALSSSYRFGGTVLWFEKV